MTSLKYIFENEDNLDLTYDFELRQNLFQFDNKNGYTFMGILMKDEVKNLPNIEKLFCVINYDKRKQEGSHWVCIIKNKNNIYHFGSFGIPVLKVILTKYNPKTYNIFYNDVPLQKTESNICGHLCVKFLQYLLTNGVNTQTFDNFLTKAKKYSNRFKLDNKKSS